MKKLVLTAMALAVAAAVIIGLSQAAPQEQPPGISGETVQAEAPPLKQLQQEAGQLQGGAAEGLNRKIEELRGYPIVINVWASWCGPCKMEAPLLRQAANQQADKVAFLGVNLKDASGPARKFIEEYRLPFPNIEDPNGEIYRKYKLRGAPSTIFIDRQGKSYTHTGAYPGLQELNQAIQQHALKQK